MINTRKACGQSHSERRAKPEVEILRKQNRLRRNLGGVSLRMTTRRYFEFAVIERVIIKGDYINMKSTLKKLWNGEISPWSAPEPTTMEFRDIAKKVDKERAV